MTKYGKSQTLRESTGNVQLNLFLYKIRELLVPAFSLVIQNLIENLVKKAHTLLEESKQSYHAAEDILLAELGLKDWEPTNQSTTTKSFSDFLKSGRLDAEYYQPKYDEIFEHLKQYETQPLGKIVTITKSIEPGSDAYRDSGVPFIRVANLSKYGLTDPDIFLDNTEYINIVKPRKDTILLSKDGSVGIAYKVAENLDMITSGAILHLNITNKEFFPDYLTLVLNSIIVKMQAERDAGGSIIQHWKPSEIEQTIIPKLSNYIQYNITEKIQESFKLKTESKRLLNLAKSAVETAIEQSEQKALELLKQNKLCNPPSTK